MSNPKIIRWNRLHAYWMSFAGLIFLGSGQFAYWVWLAAASFAYFLWQHLDLLQTYQPFAGYANWLTALRLMAILSFPWVLPQCSESLFFTWALIIILLDGVDGYLARRYQTASTFGAYFDMETDAFYVCMMSALLYQQDLLPIWILGIGWLRYLAVLVEIQLGIHGQPGPPNPYARYIAGYLFIALLLPWILPTTIYFFPVMLAAILVTWSFAYSFYLGLRSDL